jgi:hypothetical protein
MSDWVDTWARAVAHRISRRQMLGGMGALTAGAAVGGLAPAPSALARAFTPVAATRAKPLTITCPSGYVPCGTICCSPGGECIPTPAGGKVCSNLCGNNPDFQLCSGVCTDVYYDPNNCGWCGNVCPPPPPTSKGKATGQAVCEGGTCGCACDSGYRECKDSAGRCVCVTGSCPCTSSNCKDGTCCDDVCVSLQTDPSNCDECGHACTCPPGFIAICTDGSCGCVCPYTVCNGVCVDTTTNLANCGRCGNSCTAVCPSMSGFTAVCNAGTCENVETITQVCP